jgi:integrase
MKAGIQHRVPLSVRMPREHVNRFVFIGRPQKRIGQDAMWKLMRAMGRTETAHGFRSAFSDWAHETSAFPNHVIEQSLAHVVGSAVERAYRRGDMFAKRKQLMDAWARYCSTKPLKAAADNVVALRGA